MVRIGAASTDGPTGTGGAEPGNHVSSAPDVSKQARPLGFEREAASCRNFPHGKLPAYLKFIGSGLPSRPARPHGSYPNSTLSELHERRTPSLVTPGLSVDAGTIDHQGFFAGYEESTQLAICA
jgi:hypothetical protein